ncbi:hypothetical protein L9F63_002937, partial [Diploptera punctata]
CRRAMEMNATSILQGPLYQLEDYTECLYKLRKQYCLSDVKIVNGSISSPFWQQMQVLIFINKLRYPLTTIGMCSTVSCTSIAVGFSILSNWQRLGSQSTQEDSKALRCIHGMRTLSMLTPMYAVMIVLSSSWFNQMGEGPMWYQFVGSETDNCQHHWWINMLCLNNYFYCLLHTWYLAADFQNYIVTMLLLVTVKHLSLDKTFQKSYITFHNNAGPYFTGAMFGYVYFYTNFTSIKHNKSLLFTDMCMSEKEDGKVVEVFARLCDVHPRDFRIKDRAVPVKTLTVFVLVSAEKTVAVMSTALLAAIAVILCILFRILNVNSQPQKPALYCKELSFLDTILKIAPLLQEPYIPTRLWGFSGHVQTIIHSIIGRVRCPWPIGERCYLNLHDGTTLTYDLYQPLDQSHEDDFTLAICPGIGNTSESVYIRTFVHYAQCHGYRCAVLNHVGALSSVKVTAPRIFTY